MTAAMEERASILLVGSDLEAGDTEEAKRWVPPPLRMVLAGCAALAVVGATAWCSGHGSGHAEVLAAPGASSVLAESKTKAREKKEKKETTQKPVDLEAVKAMLEEHQDQAKQEEDQLRTQSATDKDSFKAEAKAAKDKKHTAQKGHRDASQKTAGAERDTKKAESLRVEAQANVTKAKQMKREANSSNVEASSALASSLPGVAAAKEALAGAREKVKRAQEHMDDAKAVELQALETAAGARICMDLPGVVLADAKGLSDFAPMLVDKEVGTPEQCTDWCRKHGGCLQAIFSAGNKSCRLFEGATTDVTVFSDGFNSSLCGASSEEDDLKAKLEEAFSHQPYIPPLVDCSWDGDDCSGTKCCNDEVCEWDFSECKSHSCFGSGDQATCMSACYGDQCENQGTGRETREIEKADAGVLVQGTSLYCFMVVVSSMPEAELADNAKDKGIGIYQCDDSDVIEGQKTDMTDWGTYINVNMFIDAWKQVEQNGKYASHDWTVKVDADAVFFPDILKDHLSQLRTPQGSRVYIKNAEYKFQFLGALHVLSRQAVALYFEKGWVCEKLDHGKQGEDYFLNHCLDSIGADHQTDFDLLSDRTTKPSSKKLDCTSGWTAAFHWAKSVDDWNACYGTALKAQEKGRTLWDAEHGEARRRI